MKFYKGQHREVDGIEQVVFRAAACEDGKGVVENLTLRVEALAETLAVMAGFLSDEQQADLAASFGWRDEK